MASQTGIDSVIQKPVAHRRFRIYFLVFFLVLIAYLDRVALSVAAPFIAKEFHLSPIAMGYLFSSFFWVYAIAVVPAGMLLDRFGTRKVVAVCLGFWSLMTIWSGVAGSLFTLYLSRFGLGIGESATLPAAAKAVREWSPLPERGFASTLSMCGNYAGPGIGAIFCGWLVMMVGWRGGFWVAGGIGLVLLAAWQIWYHKPEEARWLDEPEREKILAERGANATKIATGSAFSGLGMLLRSKSMWGLSLAHGCGIYTQYLFLTWLPTYLLHSRGGSVLKAGVFTAVPYCVAATASVAFGWVSDRVLTAETLRKGARRNIIVVMRCVSAVILLLPWASSTWQILTLLSISMTGLCVGISLHYALVTDLLLEPEHSAKAYGLTNLGGNLGGLGAPIVTGYIVAFTGSYNGAFIIAGILLIIGAALLLTMTRNTIGTAPRQVATASAGGTQ